MTHMTDAVRTSEQELVVTRTFDYPPHLVFAAWTQPALFARWWTPASCGLTLVACELDVRVGGGYRLAFSHPDAPAPMEVFGRYLEVVAPTRLVWTNEEDSASGQVTTVTFEDCGGQTRLVMHDRYPSKEALDEAIASGGTSGAAESFCQLDLVLCGPAATS